MVAAHATSCIRHILSQRGSDGPRSTGELRAVIDPEGPRHKVAHYAKIKAIIEEDLGLLQGKAPAYARLASDKDRRLTKDGHGNGGLHCSCIHVPAPAKYGSELDSCSVCNRYTVLVLVVVDSMAQCTFVHCFGCAGLPQDTCCPPGSCGGSAWEHTGNREM